MLKIREKIFICKFHFLNKYFKVMTTKGLYK